MNPRRVLRSLLVGLIFIAASGPRDARADVVPQAAIDLAERWFALADAGRAREAVDACFDDSRAPTAVARAHAPTTPLRDRAIRSWAGHGEGDVSHLEPGGYFALVFDGVDAAGRPRTVEFRMVPRSVDATRWRLVDVIEAQAR